MKRKISNYCSALVQITILMLLCGYVMNIAEIIRTVGFPIDGEFIVRVIGLVAFPIGGVMGYI